MEFFIFCIPVCSYLLTITHNRRLTFCLRSLSVVTVMTCFLSLSVHCSVISSSIGERIGIGDIIIRKYQYRRYFLNDYRYRYRRYFCKISLTTLSEGYARPLYVLIVFTDAINSLSKTLNNCLTMSQPKGERETNSSSSVSSIIFWFTEPQPLQPTNAPTAR
jgi:hypothetical protein